MQNNLEKQVDAGFFVRLAAYLIDCLIVNFALLFVRIPFWIAAVANEDNIMTRDFIFEYSMADITLYVLGVMYFILCTHNTGSTIGKRLLHLKVVSVEERDMTWFEVLFRETVGKFLSAVVLYAGYLMIATHPQKRGLHDLLSDTKVIYDHEQGVYVEASVDTQEYVAPSYEVLPTYDSEEEQE